MLHEQKWVSYEEDKCKLNVIEIAVQVNGKVKSRVTVAADCSDADAIAAAKADEKVAADFDGKTVIKEIYVKGKLVNIVAK